MPAPKMAMSYSCMAIIFTWPYTALSTEQGLSMNSFTGLRTGTMASVLCTAPLWLRGLFLVLALGCVAQAHAQASRVQTPYANPKAIVDVYLDHPAKMGAALYWVRSLVNPLTEAPYSLFPEDMSIIVLLHGTELVTVARKNEAKYEELVQRMRYYASQGVKFKVCGLAMQDYGYLDVDMQPFIEVTPSAMTELVHWQNRGYALITPQVPDKRQSIDDIR
jgi:intracellular sulfur oxidation DsrE/DsrF family protein